MPAFNRDSHLANTLLSPKYYRRSELVLRIGIFFGLAPCFAGACECYPLGGISATDRFAVGGLLASGILASGDIGSIKSWRKIFLVEGSFFLSGLRFNLMRVPQESLQRALAYSVYSSFLMILRNPRC